MRTRVLPISEASIDEACKVLLAGDLVAFPTETVYGLGGLGLNPDSVSKIFATKDRPTTDPLILHVSSADLAALADDEIIAKPIPALAVALVSQFWPGPLTLTLPKGPRVPLGVTAGLPTVAIRYPAHPAAQLLLQKLGQPIAAPSANRFGRISPTDASAVLQELEGKIPLILDGGPCTQGIESTVLSLSGSNPTILRSGAITAEMISSITEKQTLRDARNLQQSAPSPSPGMLQSHYAPQTPLYLAPTPIEHFDPPYQYILYENRNSKLPPGAYLLAPDQNPSTAAQNLYRLLRQADSIGSPAILIDPIPDSNWAPAIRDRLQRASSGTALWQNGGWKLLPRAGA